MTNPNQHPPRITIEPEIITKIRTTKEIVTRTHDFNEAQYWSKILDDELLEDGLIGDRVTVESDNMTWSWSRLTKDGSVEMSAVDDPEILNSRYATGSFVGTEVMSAEGENILLYRIESISEDDELLTLVLTVPADESILAREPVVEDKKMTPEEYILHHLYVLNRVKNDEFQKNLSDLCDLIEGLGEADGMDADFVREAGYAATLLLSDQELKDDGVLRQSVTEILASLISKGNRFIVEGEEVVIETFGEGDEALTMTSLPHVRFMGTIAAVALVTNYTYSDQEEAPVFDDSLQPAIAVIIDSEYHFLPMKGITKFSRHVVVSESTLCREALARYREEYMLKTDPVL